MKLSERLHKIALQVPCGSRLADIGSDHALLPTFLALSGTVEYGVAGELNPGPFEAASQQVAAAGLKKRIQVRRGNGLSVIHPEDEIDVVTIAGMGGGLIATILDEGRERLGPVKRLVLQPNVAEDQVRCWLDEHGWLIVHEQILEEDGKLYEIITAERAADPSGAAELYSRLTLAEGTVLHKDWLYRFGPLLVKEAPALFFVKWRSEVEKLEHICRQLAQSDTASARDKEAVFRAEIKLMEEVMACLPKAKP
ncbi:tRNA (adenine(22)-N(1))-methyltransferase [Paenibacillus sp. y28]|uniref:tRNA (adenine(22)-N(1))-methyltransferase n=1 Tax=Paenibacillus sp. y28 TaxID=3129110 RepID=UPI003FA70B01